jgi:hypothetical protein
VVIISPCAPTKLETEKMATEANNGERSSKRQVHNEAVVLLKMSEGERRVREKLTLAIRLFGEDAMQLMMAWRVLGELPRLSKQECRNIACNYPFSDDEIESAFRPA